MSISDSFYTTAFKGAKLAKKILRSLRAKVSPSELAGDRDIEWSFVAANMPSGPGEALDFGPGPGSSLCFIAARRGFQVTAIDLEEVRWRYSHPRLRFIRGDVLRLSLPENSIDLILNCSSVEHVGLVGRYGISESRPDGDLEVMTLFRKLLRPQGCMLLTIPVGKDTVFPPLHRVYGNKRLSMLLEGYIVEKEEYWLKDLAQDQWYGASKAGALARPPKYWVKEQGANNWRVVTRAEALTQEPERFLYGIGCFVLRVKK